MAGSPVETQGDGRESGPQRKENRSSQGQEMASAALISGFQLPGLAHQNVPSPKTMFLH
jgi:hypothetical protein